jgi:hypothetical protein
MGSPGRAVSIVALVVAACSGGGDGPPPPPSEHVVDIAWDRNHEAAVNAPGGGYQVTIGAYPPLDVPYVSSLLAPTSITTTLWTGTYAVSVRAYGRAPGGGTTTLGAASQIALRVP